ncbi:MAG: DUF3887 domain-containing protein [Methanosarcinaceae archaeon]
MNKRIIAGLIVLVTIVAVMIFGGCVEKNQIDTDQVRKYADPITENILLGMNGNNYSKYSEHFDQTMKNAMPEAVFYETNSLINSKIGDYVSKQFWKVESKDQYTIIYYKARFTEEPDDVIVKVVFQKIIEEMEVSGLGLDSPKLREK